MTQKFTAYLHPESKHFDRFRGLNGQSFDSERAVADAFLGGNTHGIMYLEEWEFGVFDEEGDEIALVAISEK